MALILNIDTSAETASVCFAKDYVVVLLLKNEQQKDHATWLHVAIKQLMEETKTELAKIDAVAVTIGPGSYTGLRVGLSAAKGICYALEKPLLTISALLVMANACKHEPADLFCPMIDARRMEVFTALYTKDLELIKEPVAMVIDESSFEHELASKTICFSGSGSVKFKALIKNPNATFSNSGFDASGMVSFAESFYQKKQFADLAYTGPLYLKEFYTPSR